MVRLRIALVGVGGYGALYAQALLNAQPELNVVFTAGIDPYPEQSSAWQGMQQAGVPVFPDLNTFLKQQDADLVVIAAPIHLHAALTCLVLQHKAAVLCEKPLAATLEEGLSMLAAELRSGFPVVIGYQWSFSAAIQALKQDIQAGVLGAPRRMKTLVLWPRAFSYYRRNHWAGRMRMPDGAWVLDSPVNNATAHYLHNMLYLLGEQRETSGQPTRLQAELYRANDIENFDAAALRVWTEAGVEILFYTAHPVREQVDPWMEFEFEGAVVTYRGGPPPACGIAAALSHTRVVEALRSVQIIQFPASLLRQQELKADRLVWVEGLGETFQQAFLAGVLPAELGKVSWSRASSVFNIGFADNSSGEDLYEAIG